MIVADTSAWIDYVKGIDAPHTEALDSALLHDRVVTGDLILAGFLQGFRNEADLRDVLARWQLQGELLYGQP